MVGVGRRTDKRMGQGEWRDGGGDAILIAKRVLNGGHVSALPPQATCRAVGGGQRLCTCPPDYGGDGFSCYRDILKVSGSLLSDRSPLMYSGLGRTVGQCSGSPGRGSSLTLDR